MNAGKAGGATTALSRRLGGGAATVRQYLEAGLIDEMHVAVSPVLLGAGASLPHGIDLPALGYRRTEYVSGGKAAHFIVAKS
jgi:dihydrofolate reductase